MLYTIKESLMTHDPMPAGPAEHRFDGLANLKRTIMDWKRRRVSVRPLDDAEKAGCR